LSRILVVAKKSRDNEGLCSSLKKINFDCLLTPDDENIRDKLSQNPPDLVIIESGNPARLNELSRQIKQVKNPPVIALLEADMLGSTGEVFNYIDDFVMRPYRLSELEIRIKKLLRRESTDASEQIKRGDLVIDLAKCEVSVAGRPILLTFKEYQLLKFLAGNQGRVFSRDALLNKVWGYEYYGGDRTVDVHIKRLRSKIEDANHAFIETVRNIGYRLKAD